MKRQKIVIIEHEGCEGGDFHYEANPIDQPGSPIVGRGKTPLKALIQLLEYNEKFRIEVIDQTGE